MSQRFANVPGGDAVVLVDATSANETVPLPRGYATGRRFVVRRIDSSAFTVTVSPPSGESLDGAVDATTTIAGNGEKAFLLRDPLLWESFGADLTPYGAGTLTATGVSATDSAALQARHDALPSTGGEIQLAPGTYSFSGVTFTKPVRLRGIGPAAGPISTAGGYSTETSLTKITCASATAKAISLGAGAHGSVIENVHIINTSPTPPTSGAGIAIDAQLAGCRFRNVTIAGFYRNFDFSNGYEWFMDECNSYDFVYSGLRIANPSLPDAGDMGITNSQFIAGPNNLSPSSGIEWNSAGGLRMVGNKVNKRGAGTLACGVYLHTSDGITTGVFLFSANSFENMAYGIYCDDAGNTGTGIISKIAITSNEFLCTTKGIYFSRTSSGKVGLISINGNIITSGTSTGGVQLTNAGVVIYGGNIFSSNITPAGKMVKGSGTTLISQTSVVSADTVGTATLNGATPVTVTTGSVTAASLIFLTIQSAGGTPATPRVNSVTAGTSFTIVSTAGDTSTVAWQLIEPL